MKKVVLILCLIFIASFVLAVPSIPNVFSGIVTYSEDSETSLTGYDVSCSINGYALGIVGQIGEDNIYSVMVDPQGRTGEITFYIGGVEASPRAEYEMGEFTELDLTIYEMPSYAMCGNGIQEPGEQCDGADLGIGTCENVLGILGATGTLSCTDYCTFDYVNCSAPYCGDGICNNGETCSTCPGDCGACPSSSSSSSGSSSGGGGGSSSSSSGSGVINLNTSNNDNEVITLDFEQENQEEILEEETQEDTNARVTGGVIGTGTGGSLIIIGIILVIVIIVLVVASKKKSYKNAKE
jgi:uncharacterized membrane protein YgcG